MPAKLNIVYSLENFEKMTANIANPKVLVAQLGARKHYQEPILFHQWGMLDRLYTDFYSGNNLIATFLRQPKIYGNLPKLCQKSLDRYDPSLNQTNVISFPWLGYKWAKARSKNSLRERSSLKIWAFKEFCRHIISTNPTGIDTAYGFNGASLELFEYAKAKGMRCILDQTIAEPSLLHQLLLTEEQSWQDWSKSPFTVSKDDLELREREQREQDLADHIICGSNFVKESLMARGISAEKISVVNLGRCQDGQRSSKQAKSQTPKEQGKELKILFAGSVGLRKGIPYLLEALKQLKGEIPFVCKIAGSLDIQSERIDQYRDVANFLGRVSRSQMAELYNWADVFVLPSICEGSAMVTYEALNYGLPIITTHNTGSIVRDGIDGFIVPICDADAIARKLLTLFSQPSCLPSNNNLTTYLTEVYKNSEASLHQVLTSVNQKEFLQQ